MVPDVEEVKSCHKSFEFLALCRYFLFLDGSLSSSNRVFLLSGISRGNRVMRDESYEVRPT